MALGEDDREPGQLLTSREHSSPCARVVDRYEKQYNHLCPLLE